MKTFPIPDPMPGHCWAFEIQNIYISAWKLGRVLPDIGGVKDFQVPRLFKSRDDIRARFKFGGRDFVVWEPWGDSSRYWIGPQDVDDKSVDISSVRAAVEKYHPPLLIKVIGDIISLQIS